MPDPEIVPGTIPLRERRTFEDEWREFDTHILVPAKVGETQRREMRRAFYSGASAWYNLTMTSFDPHAEPTDLDVEYMQQLDQELRTFAVSVAMGLS